METRDANLERDPYMLHKDQGKNRYKTCQTIKQETLHLLESNRVKCYKRRALFLSFDSMSVKIGLNGDSLFKFKSKPC
jgi:hypothetical protein